MESTGTMMLAETSLARKASKVSPRIIINFKSLQISMPLHLVKGFYGSNNIYQSFNHLGLIILFDIFSVMIVWTVYFESK